MSRFGGGPEKVADKIEKAISSPAPEDPLQGHLSAGATMGMRKAMTDKMWDRAMAQQYKRPGPDPDRRPRCLTRSTPAPGSGTST